MSFLFCPKCGKEVASGTKFCAYCGAALEDNGNADTPEKTAEQKQNEFQRFCHDENAQTVVNANNSAVGSGVAPATDREVQKSETVKVDTVSDGLMKEFLASCGVARRYDEKRLSLKKKAMIFNYVSVAVLLLVFFPSFILTIISSIKKESFSNPEVFFGLTFAAVSFIAFFVLALIGKDYSAEAIAMNTYSFAHYEFLLVLKEWLLKEKNIDYRLGKGFSAIDKIHGCIIDNIQGKKEEDISLRALEREFESKSLWGRILLSKVPFILKYLSFLCAFPIIVEIFQGLKIIPVGLISQNLMTCTLYFGIVCYILFTVFYAFGGKWYSVEFVKWCRTKNRSMLDLASCVYTLKNMDKPTEELTGKFFLALYYNELTCNKQYYVFNIISIVLKIASLFILIYAGQRLGKVLSVGYGIDFIGFFISVFLGVVAVIIKKIGNILKR